MDKALLPSNVRDELFSQLMDSYGTEILRMCWLYLQDKVLAEDAAQDTFIKAFKNIDRLLDAPVDAEKPWLMRIAINTCKDYRRSAWLRHVDRRIDPENIISSEEFSSDDDLFLFQAVAELPIKLKTIVLLHYYQDISVKEIALALNVAESTVYSRLERAKKKLRQTIVGEALI